MRDELPYCSNCHSFGFGNYCPDCGCKMTNCGDMSENKYCRQDAKPLTVEHFNFAMEVIRGNPSDEAKYAYFTDPIVNALVSSIRANIPTDQSARIAELEDYCDQLESRIVHSRQGDRDFMTKTLIARANDIGRLLRQNDQLTQSLESANDRIERALKVYPTFTNGFDPVIISNNLIDVINEMKRILKGEGK